MDGWLKQSTALSMRIGPFLDETDGKTAETGLTISQADVRLSKAGGDFAQKNDSDACTHDEIGYYICPLNTTDTGTLGMLKLAVHEAGALPVWHTFMVVPTNVWDSLFGADKLQVHADEITAGLITATAIADNALTAAKIAADAIANVKIADGAITAAKIASDAIATAKIADGALTAAKFAAASLNGKGDWNVGKTDYSLTATTGLGNQTANITGNMSGSVGSIGTGGIAAASFASGAIDATAFAQGAADKVWATAARSLTDKADFALSSASRDAIWDQASALTLSFEALLTRAYQMINNKMNVTEANGNVALRNIGDTGNIATGNVASSSGTTTRAELTWA